MNLRSWGINYWTLLRCVLDNSGRGSGGDIWGH